MRFQRRLAVALLIVAITVALGAITLALTTFTRGIGSFEKTFYLNSSKPIRTISYCSANVDDEWRQRAQAEALPAYFDWQRTITPSGAAFTASVTFTDKRSYFFETKIYHHRQFVILAEFHDGTRACRVIDLAEGIDKQPTTVDFDNWAIDASKSLLDQFLEQIAILLRARQGRTRHMPFPVKVVGFRKVAAEMRPARLLAA
jgi:hypothetical protein